MGGDPAPEDDYPDEVACPVCAATVPSGGRFATWCEDCGWNAVPTHSAPADGRRQGWFARRYDAVTFEAARRAHGQLVGRTQVPRRRGLELAGVAMWVLVLVLFAAFVALVVWWTVAGQGFWHWPGAVLGVLVVAALVSATLARPGRGQEVDRANAPELYALVDAVSEAVGSPSVARILVDASDNASVRVRTLRRRPDLTIGLLLWTRLPEDQRVALIGHELAHLVGRAPVLAQLMSTSQRLLAAVVRLVWPGGYDLVGMSELSVSRGVFGSGVAGRGEQLIAAGVQRVLALPAVILFWITQVLDAHARQRREYAADLASVDVAGTDGITGLLVNVLPSVGWRAEIGAAVRRGEDPWRAITAMRPMPPREVSRLRRVSAVTGLRLNASHPPTHLRLSLVESRSHRSRTPMVDRASAAVERELDPYRRRLTDVVTERFLNA